MMLSEINQPFWALTHEHSEQFLSVVVILLSKFILEYFFVWSHSYNYRLNSETMTWCRPTPPSLDLTFCHEIFENCHKWYIESSLIVVVNVKYLATGQILCIWNPSQRKEFLCDWCDCLVGHSLVLPGHLSLLRPPTSSPSSSPASSPSSSWLVIA